MPTMLHGAALAEHYLADHPGTTLTRNAIKRLLREGVIPAVRAGSRTFYSLEAFEDFLERGSDETVAPFGTLRAVR